jgi:hypothetical protein
VIIVNGIRDYRVSGNFLSTSGDALGSTVVTASVPFSSGATSTGNAYLADYFWAITYRKPQNPSKTKYLYQAMFYNPTTNELKVEVFSEQIGFSTGSTQDYMSMGSFYIPGATEPGLGRYMTTPQAGWFNGVNMQFRFTNPTTYAKADNSTTYRSYMAIKEYL